MHPRYREYAKYMKNTCGEGCSVKVEHFIEDWEPIGKEVLDCMEEDGVVTIKDGVATLTNSEEN
jgi:hypothetical protein